MTINTRPPQITDAHLRRKAVVYVRQSSEEEVRHNVGSTALQRDLAGVLHNWGWPRESIEILEGDLGISGSQAGLRQSFNTLVQAMDAGGVGVVAVTDISRLGRNHEDLFTFVMTARRRDVLLLHGEQITDFGDPNSEFTGLILGLNAARENRARTEHARRARRKKAEAGIACTATPAGYIAERGGAWRKDPDDRVREVIQLVLDKFLELGSCGAVCRYLAQHEILVPGRRVRGSVTWSRPSRVRIYRVLRNPAYAGVYVYGATQTRDGRQARVSPEDRIYVEEHHEPYIARHRWAEIQERRRGNRRSLRAPLGRGDALLQGLLRCSSHNRGFGTFYPTRERRDGTVIRRAFYRCFDASSISEKFCAAVRASTLDSLIERELFRVLRPPAADVMREIHSEAKREYEALVRLRESTERHAEQAAAEAERAYHQADASHSLVKQRLSLQWEDALRRVEQIRTEHRLHPLTAPLTLTDAEQVELQQLLTDLPSLWRHPRVTPEQRKALARAVIATIDVNPGPAAWTLEIAWVGGQRTRVEFLTSKGVHDIVEQAFRDGRTAAEIAQLLSERGAIQRSGPHIGQPYTATSVKLLIRKLGGERSFKRDAYIYLRARYLEGIPLRQIAKELTAQGVRHPLGEWTEHRVQRAIYRLRTHPVADVAQLPGIDRLADKVMALHDAGLFATEIAAKLRPEGALTMRRRPVTPDTVRQIVRRRRGLRSQDGGARKRRRAVRADGTRRATEATRETVVSPDAPMAQLLVGRPEARESTVLGAQDPIIRQ